MSTIKKGFTSIYNVLVSNTDKKVEDILPQLIALMESKQRDENNYTDEDGNLFIFCYYHKKWEMTSQIEYGRKASTKTGFNSMCKIGTNQWTRQQREYKASRGVLLQLVADEKILFENLKDEMAKLEDEKDKIVSLSGHYHQEGLDMEEARQLAEAEAQAEKQED